MHWIRRQFDVSFAGAALHGVLAFVAIFAAAVGVTGCLGGCNAEARSTHRSERRVILFADGRVESETRVNADARSAAPGPTSQPTLAAATETGASAQASGQQSKPIGAYVAEQEAWVYGGAAVALVVAAAIAFWAGQRMLAACLLAASLIVAVGPTVADLAAPYIAAGVLLTIAVGIAWAFARLYANRRENRSAVASALKLTSAGQPMEAIAALRESPLAREIRTAAKGGSKAAE